MTMLVEGIKDRIGEYIVSRVESLAKIQHPSQGFADEIYQLLSEGHRPIIISNHQSHADGFIMRKVVRILREISAGQGGQPRLEGCVMPVASSMVSGHQNKVLQLVYHLTRGAMLRKGIICMPYTRPADEVKYGLRQNFGEVKRMRRVINNNPVLGLVDFPEARVEGGRCIEGGWPDQIKGMIELEDNALVDPYRMLNGAKEPFFLPVGIDGSHRIFSPDTYAPKTWQAYLTFLGAGLHLASVRIGSPITTQELRSNLGSNWLTAGGKLNRFVMGRVANLVSESARGVYKEQALNLVL